MTDRLTSLLWVNEAEVSIGELHAERDEPVAAVFVADVERFLAGRPLRSVVDRSRGY